MVEFRVFYFYLGYITTLCSNERTAKIEVVRFLSESFSWLTFFFLIIEPMLNWLLVVSTLVGRIIIQLCRSNKCDVFNSLVSCSVKNVMAYLFDFINIWILMSFC